MNPRASISILACCIGILSAQAQSEKLDSLQRKKEEEIYINQEAVKSIEFNFMPQPEIINSKPMINKDKPWMKFRKELPITMTDTTTLHKNKFIRLLPYSIWGEDTSAKEYLQEDSLTMKLDLKYLKAKYGHIKSDGFNVDKFLYENFSKRGKVIRRNRKRAKTRKSYENYVPTKEDHLKWYGKKKRILKDTLTITKKDSTTYYFINTK